MTTTYVFSIDLECDGHTPLRHNCREMAVVVIDPRKVDPTSETATRHAIVASWYWLIEHDASKPPQKETMEWAATQPEMIARWNDPNTRRVPMEVALQELKDKIFELEQVVGKIKRRWVAAPASFDWAFLGDRMGSHCECLSTMRFMTCNVLSSLLGEEITIEKVYQAINPWHWPHTHHPTDDAMHQALEYCLIKRINWRQVCMYGDQLSLF